MENKQEMVTYNRFKGTLMQADADTKCI